MNKKQAFGQSLQQVRKAAGLTQEDFSESSSRTYLSSLERGLKSPTLEKIEAIASTLNVHPLTLLVLTYQKAGRKTNLDTLLKRVTKEIKAVQSQSR